MIRPVFRAGKNDPWTGLKELDSEEMTLYPNPFEDEFHIMWNRDTDAEYQLLDMHGRLVLSGRWSGSGAHLIQAQGLAPGVYLMRVTEDAGASVVHQLVVRP